MTCLSKFLSRWLRTVDDDDDDDDDFDSADFVAAATCAAASFWEATETRLSVSKKESPDCEFCCLLVVGGATGMSGTPKAFLTPGIFSTAQSKCRNQP